MLSSQIFQQFFFYKLLDDRAKPEEIEKLANEVLAISLRAGRSEIDKLSQDIRALVNRLPDVDNILASTQADLDKAKMLLEAAGEAE